MGQTIGQFLPLAIGIAISPIPVIAIILMLITPKARTNGLAFLGGWAAGLAVVGALVLIVGSTLDVATESTPWHGAFWLRLILGIVLLAAAVHRWRSRPAPGEEAPMPKWMHALDTFTPGRSVAVAFLLSAVNPKNLILTIGAAGDIAQSGLSAIEQVLLLIVLILIASVGIIVPLVLFFAMGERSQRILGEWRGWLAANEATIMAVLFVVFGFLLIGKGITGLSIG